MIISFAKTQEEFMSGKKTVTRRDWNPRYLKQWQKAWDEGKLIHDGWSKSPRAGGHFLAKFRLTCRPYLEQLKNMPESDLEAEGGMCKTLEDFYFLIGKAKEDFVAVIRFVFRDQVI
mgnify:CR=1 FL=1